MHEDGHAGLEKDARAEAEPQRCILECLEAWVEDLVWTSAVGAWYVLMVLYSDPNT